MKLQSLIRGVALALCIGIACNAMAEENIDPKKPLSLPLLFALDAKLGINDGFYYSPDCKRTGTADGGTLGGLYCAGDISGGGCGGGGSGWRDASGSGGDSGSGDGPGSGGGGCSGGD